MLNRNKITGKTVVAMDTYQDTLDWIQKGVIAATIAQKPFTMAFYGLKVLDDLYHHKPASLDHFWVQDSQAPIPSFIDTGATLIDKNNVANFRRASDAAIVVAISVRRAALGRPSAAMRPSWIAGMRTVAGPAGIMPRAASASARA